MTDKKITTDPAALANKKITFDTVAFATFCDVLAEWFTIELQAYQNNNPTGFTLEAFFKHCAELVPYDPDVLIALDRLLNSDD